MTRTGVIRLGLGVLAVGGCLLAMGFSVIFHPPVYFAVVALLALWIGLWPLRVSNLGSRVFIAGAGSIGVSVVLLIFGEVIARVKNEGQEEFGPLLFVPAFLMAMGLPVLVLSVLVAALGPRFQRRR